MPVTFIRPELARVIDSYEEIDDCLAGPKVIKSKRTKYLPNPEPKPDTPEARKRYDAYLGRAIFYAIAKGTLNGMTGVVFAREPVSEIPNELDAIELDATGSGVSLKQLSKRNLALNLSKGRAGVLVDYPDTSNATMADIQSGRIRPTIEVIEPQRVINWREFKDGAKTLYSLVVIAEQWPFQDDGFEIKYACQFRVLELVGAGYRVTIYRERVPTGWGGGEISKHKQFEPAQVYYPTDVAGNPIQEIPFMFTGPENNDSAVDYPPFAPLVELNLGHYRNSADYEEGCFMMGQPTLVAIGITESWFENQLKGELVFGSRGGIALPDKADAKLLQMEANSMAYEAMQHKEKQMVAIGARLVQQKTVQRTATEAGQDHATETSFLAAAADNTSAAMEWALKWCAFFMGLAEDRESAVLEYKLNTNFDMMTIDATVIGSVTSLWEKGAITFGEMRAVIRQSGVATEDDAAAKKLIDKEVEDQVAKAAARIEAETNAASVGIGDDNAE